MKSTDYQGKVMQTILDRWGSRLWILTAIVSTMIAVSASAQGTRVNPLLVIELNYIEALSDARMPDYAELVLNEVAARFPDAKMHLKKIRLEQLLRQGKFDEAKAMIVKEPDPELAEVWVMKLTLADYYYAYGKYPEALGIYKGFFEKYKAKPPEAIAAFYMESYYKFAQMLLFLNRDQEALVAYEDLMALNLEKEMKRQVQFEGAQLMVRLTADMKPGKELTDLLAKAKKSTEDLMWVQDLWFGRGIVLLAQIEVIKGNIEAANKLVKQYMPQLKNIDSQLLQQSRETGEDLSRLSPIAECRYLMGSMMQDAAEKLMGTEPVDTKKAAELLVSALTEMVNVYVKYPSTSWAPDALTRSEVIQAVLKDKFGVKDIQIYITPEQRKVIAEKQFANARMLFNQSQFEKAVDVFAVVLNQFPEAIPESIDALSEFARSYIQLSDNQEDEAKLYSDLCAETIIGHLAERFSKLGTVAMTKAGDELRRIAEFYGERNQLAERDETYQLFFELYPEHALAAPVLMSSAETLYRAEDYAGAAPRYKTLMNFYAKSPISFDAMMRLADCYSKLGDVENEIKVRQTYVERVAAREKPGQALVTGLYMLARLNRTEGLRQLKEANLKFDEARRAEPQAAPAEGEAAPAEGEVVAVDPIVSSMEDMKKANQILVGCVNDFGKIIKLLSAATRSQYQNNKEEADKNDSILQGALFDRAYTLTAITQPADKISGLKKMAIDGYEMLLTQYPKSEMAPAVLMQMGTLWSTMKTEDAKALEENMKKADAIFTRLSAEFPDSEQAKNAYFLRGRTLIELGFRREGVEVLKKMFGDSGKYSAFQMLSAAEELLKSQEYDLAREGFDLAVKGAAGQPTITIPAEFGLAEILFAKKQYTAAADALEKFIAANPTSYKVLDANLLLSKSASQAAFEETDRNNRVKLFNRAILAIRAVKQYKKSAKDLAEIEIAVGRILETKIEVERKYNNLDLVSRYIGEAASHYQQFVMAADRKNAEVLPSLETAYRQSIKLTLEMKTYADGTPVYSDVKADCEAYLALFPNGRYITDIRASLTEAEIGLATGR